MQGMCVCVWGGGNKRRLVGGRRGEEKSPAPSSLGGLRAVNQT